MDANKQMEYACKYDDPGFGTHFARVINSFSGVNLLMNTVMSLTNDWEYRCCGCGAKYYPGGKYKEKHYYSLGEESWTLDDLKQNPEALKRVREVLNPGLLKK